MSNRPRARCGQTVGTICLLALTFASCDSAQRPNVLWIVWDTVRADHLSLYGHLRETTPQLDRWAQGARVFENCLSPAGYTLPSHASMFTGLLPSEHCAHNAHRRLDGKYTTIAELLRSAGYQTYLYSANPHISSAGNFDQGFDLAEHPWSDKYRERALNIMRAKLPEVDRSSELGRKFEDYESGAGALTHWNIKSAGELAQEALLAWLATVDSQRPFYAFLNYMEAHRPYLPPREHRERMMSEDEIVRSYQVDRSWYPIWEYTFGLRDYDDEQIELTRATYDATLAELDDQLASLLAALEAGGYLDNTVVILTSDHGEHLGEQHMLDHQYSVYQPLLRVPLVVHYPPRFSPGRDTRPVMNFDVFPTLLELTGVDPPLGLDSRAISLLSPADERPRLAEDPASSAVAVATIKQRHPEWDPSPWERRLRAWNDGGYKFIWGSDERHELFDLSADPGEDRNLLHEREDVAERMQGALEEYYAGLLPCETDPASSEPLSPEQLELLRSLGYVP